MKLLQYFILIFSLALVMTGCESNYDEIQIVTIDNPSQELPTARVTGQVRNMKNETVENATVHVLHNLEVHDVFTDSEGWYEINLPLDHSVVRLQAESDSYSNANIVVQHLLEAELKQDLFLAQAGDMPYDYKNTAVITDSLRTVSGFIEYADGIPVAGEVIFLIDYETYDISSYAISDVNGYFSIAVEPFENRTLIVTGSCSNLEPIIEDFSVTNEDVDLGTITVDFHSFQQVIFSGLVVDCNTNKALSFGDISITIGSKTVTGKIIAGQYSLTVPNCEQESCYDITIKSALLTTGEINIVCEVLTGLEVKKDYEICGAEVDGDGVVAIEVDGQSRNYNVAIASLQGNLWKVEAYDPATFEQLIFFFPAEGLGEHDVTVFGISDSMLNPLYIATLGQGNLKVNLIENTMNLSGDLSGYVINGAEEQVSITGGFEIEL